MCVWLEGDSAMVEEFVLSLGLAVGHTIQCGTSLATTGQFAVAYFGPLPVCGGVAYCCVSLFACVCCVMVVFGSVRDVQLLFFIK